MWSLAVFEIDILNSTLFCRVVSTRFTVSALSYNSPGIILASRPAKKHQSCQYSKHTVDSLLHLAAVSFVSNDCYKAETGFHLLPPNSWMLYTLSIDRPVLWHVANNMMTNKVTEATMLLLSPFLCRIIMLPCHRITLFPVICTFKFPIQADD